MHFCSEMAEIDALNVMRGWNIVIYGSCLLRTLMENENEIIIGLKVRSQQYIG